MVTPEEVKAGLGAGVVTEVTPGDATVVTTGVEPVDGVGQPVDGVVQLAARPLPVAVILPIRLASNSVNQSVSFGALGDLARLASRGDARREFAHLTDLAGGRARRQGHDPQQQREGQCRGAQGGPQRCPERSHESTWNHFPVIGADPPCRGGAPSRCGDSSGRTSTCASAKGVSQARRTARSPYPLLTSLATNTYPLVTLYLTCVTPGASTARICSSSISALARFSNRRAPSPSSTGTMWSSSSSRSPSARYC
jgi:hypothetical protein